MYDVAQKERRLPAGMAAAMQAGKKRDGHAAAVTQSE